jgi:ubiquinone/menaquinone biosynthesis C-methylase UbiE
MRFLEKEVSVAELAFDEHAEAYDSWFMKNQKVLVSEILLLKEFLQAPGDALSIGCGSGLFESFLRNDHGIVIEQGIEPAAGMAAIAEKRGMQVRIALAENLPYEDERFDSILMNGIPAYLKDLGKGLREALRVLKNSGKIVIGDVPATSSYGLLYQLAGRIGSWEDPQLKKIAPNHPYPIEFVKEASWRTTEEISAVLKEIGFRKIKYAQTLTVHARFSNDAIEEPIAGFERGGYVAICAEKPERI